MHWQTSLSGCLFSCVKLYCHLVYCKNFYQSQSTTIVWLALMLLYTIHSFGFFSIHDMIILPKCFAVGLFWVKSLIAICILAILHPFCLSPKWSELQSLHFITNAYILHFAPFVTNTELRLLFLVTVDTLELPYANATLTTCILLKLLFLTYHDLQVIHISYSDQYPYLLLNSFLGLERE